MTTGIRKAGDFCWINMITPRSAQACEFFGKVLGWTFFEMPGLGFGVRVGGRDIGGLFDQDAPGTPKGTPAYIGVMLKVDNVDATAAKVTALGGTVKLAMDVMDQGRMAVCFDPNGAEFDIWQPKKLLGTDVDTTLHGAPSWFETLTTDADRAASFYAALFGWTPNTMAMPGGSYTTFKLGDTFIAGMMTITPEMAQHGVRPHWGTYVTVNDTDVAASVAQKAGATIFIPPRDIPNVGRFCGLISPQGVRFYTITYKK